MIVPEDMYRGLLDATKTKDTAGESNAGGQQLLDQDEAIGLNRSNNAMSKALNARKVKNSATNFGTNNALYSQELRRYLRLRKQAMDRPIRVAIAKNPPILPTKMNVRTTPAAAAAAAVANRPKIVPRKRRRIRPLHFLTPAEEEEEEGGAEENAEVLSNDIRDAGNFDDWFEQQQQQQATTSRQSAARRRRHRETKGPQSLARAINAFKGYIMENRASFGVSPDGKVKYLSSNKAIPGADLEAIAERLVNPNMENMPSPPGTSIIANKAYKDSFLRTLMFDRFYTNEKFIPTYSTPKGWRSKKSSSYSSAQDGEGLKRSSLSTNKFIPSKWKH